MPVNIRPRTGIRIIALLAELIVLVGCGTSVRTTHSPNGKARVTPIRQPASSWPADELATTTSIVSSPAAGAIVVIGASVSGGYKATPGGAWPNELARILKQAGRPNRVVNDSIGATRLLTDNGPSQPSFLTREYSALAVSEAGAVVLADVINDIQQPPHRYDPAVIIAGLRSFVAKAHIRGVKAIGATIPPYGGFVRYAAAGERCRRAVNHAIRRDHLFDGVIDFDAALRDPADHLRIRPGYDSGDHLHPNNTGHQAMARAINPKLFILTSS